MQLLRQVRELIIQVGQLIKQLIKQLIRQLFQQLIKQVGEVSMQVAKLQ